MKRREAIRYANAVLQVLEAEFPAELGDDLTREIIANAVYAHATAPSDATEIIVDDPASANWRLKADRDDPERVRLAFCPLNPDRRDEREARIGEALAAIPQGGA